MTSTDFMQLGFYFLLLAVAVPLLGGYMARVLGGDLPWLVRWLKPCERLIYRLAGVQSTQEMNARSYALALLAFNLMGFGVVLGLQLLQSWLPLNPAQLSNVEFGVALNTAISFMTNTNWQAYSGESSLSYLTQMLGLNVQNFVSAATGIAVLAALARGLSRRETQEIGNFWADLVRSCLYILLPLSLVLSLLLVSQGAVQSFAPYTELTTLEGTTQTIPLGPAASQIAIKQLGTNGGGYFGVNSAHPLENPTPLSNFLQMLAILLIPAALTYSFGKMVGQVRQGLVLLAAMTLIFIGCLSVGLWAEFQPNPALSVSQQFEGKEIRFGLVNSVLWANATTAASNGSVNAMHDSLSPLGGGITLLNILLGEVVFGGVGAGLYGLLMFVILTVFIAGLMVGRTPEYLGKKIEAYEIRLAAVAVVLPSAVVLVFTALALITPAGLAGLQEAGPHGLSEALYAFASQANNNGSAFGGLSAAAPFYAYLGALAMLIGRFGVILPVLAIAGHMAAKKSVPVSAGTFPTDSTLFVVLLVGVVLIVGALTFFPVLALGPLVEHLLMLQGKVF